MKLKNGVIITSHNGEFVAVAAGEAAANFNGMMKLNSTAAFICTLLKNDTDIEKITDALCEEFEVDRETAKQNVQKTVDTLNGIGLIAK
jgi:methyltransferase-like protein